MSQTVPATAVLGPGATGLTIGLRVLNLDGTEYAAFSTTGVAETSTLGTYRKASGVVCPDAGAYSVWGVSGTDYAEATVEPVTALSDIQSRIPAALIGGRMDATVGAISGDVTAADNLETMLDGTGGQVLSLKQIDIVNNDSAPGGQGIDITARTGIRVAGSNQGVSLVGGTNQALYLASSAGAATIYVEGPSVGGGSAIAISSPGASPAGTSANGEAVWIETGDGHPALRIDFGVAGGDVLDVVDSDNGDWVWDDKVFAALTSQNVRDALKLAPTAGTPAAGSIDAKLDLIDTNVDDIQLVTDSLDRSALTVVAQNDVGAITIIATVSLAATISGLTIPADWTACYWTVKRSVDDTDADALIQIVVSNPPDAEDGLLALVGAAPDDSSAGSIVVNPALGTVTIALDDASTAELEDAVELVWDVKVHSPSGKTQPGTGTAIITTAVTRA